MELNSKQYAKRSAILTCLRNTHTHPSAETLHQLLQDEHPDISLATVYRNLALFKRQGLIQSLGTVDGFERFDGNIQPHVHFICTSCHSILDLPQMQVPQQLKGMVERQCGGQVSECQLSFTGVCQQCCQNEKTA